MPRPYQWYTERYMFADDFDPAIHGYVIQFDSQAELRFHRELERSGVSKNFRDAFDAVTDHLAQEWALRVGLDEYQEEQRDRTQ